MEFWDKTSLERWDEAVAAFWRMEESENSPRTPESAKAYFRAAEAFYNLSDLKTPMYVGEGL